MTLLCSPVGVSNVYLMDSFFVSCSMIFCARRFRQGLNGFTLADTVHQRNYSEKLRVYMIEKCKPIFA